MRCRICHEEFYSSGDYEAGESCLCGQEIPPGVPFGRFYGRKELPVVYLKVARYRLAELFFKLGNRLID